MRPYNIHTDLACESEATHDAGKGGTAYTEREEGGFRVAKLQVKNAAGEAATGKKCGSYVTVFTELLCDESDARLGTLAALIAAEIEALAATHLGGTPQCVLVAGLGNREITADSIGPKTVDRLTVTRHIRAHDEALFRSFCRIPLCAIAPGVLGQTGIKTAELIGGVAETANRRRLSPTPSPAKSGASALRTAGISSASAAASVACTVSARAAARQA